MKLFDSHCHLQDERFSATIDDIMQRATDAEVTYMLCCATCERDWDAVNRLAGKYPAVIPALGIHPWFIDEVSDRWYERLTELITDNPAAVVGEIGLDHALAQRDDEKQFAVFLRQLTLAQQLQRPVSVHCRKAWGTLLDLLRKQPELGTGMVIHSYSGSTELIEELSGFGVHFSFSGSITYERNTRGRTAVQHIPEERLLIETDCPDIAPQNWTGDNEPANCLKVAQTIALLRETTVENIAERTFNNACRLFHFCSE